MKLFENLLSRFRNSEFAKNAAVLSLGTAFSQGIFIGRPEITSGAASQLIASCGLLDIVSH
jgi:hypothetical protein